MCKYTHYLGPNMQAVTETSYGNHISCNSDLTRCISSVFKSSEEEKKTHASLTHLFFNAVIPHHHGHRWRLMAWNIVEIKGNYKVNYNKCVCVYDTHNKIDPVSKTLFFITMHDNKSCLNTTKIVGCWTKTGILWLKSLQEMATFNQSSIILKFRHWHANMLSLCIRIWMKTKTFTTFEE